MEAWWGWAICLAMVLTIIFYLSWPAWKLQHIPCPPYMWGVGHLPLMMKEKAQVFVRLAREYGPIYRFHIGRQPIVIVADGELCRQLGIKNFKAASNRSVPAFIECAQVHKDGLFFSKGAQWTGMRNILLPLFHSEQMLSFTPLLTRIIDTFVSNLGHHSASEEVNISDLFHRYALDVIGESAFGTQFNLLDDGSGRPGNATDLQNPDQELVNRAIESPTRSGTGDITDQNPHQEPINRAVKSLAKSRTDNATNHHIPDQELINRAVESRAGSSSGTGNATDPHNPDQELVDRAVKSLAALRMDVGAPASTIAGILFPVLQRPLRSLLTRIPCTADWQQATSNAKLVQRLTDLVERRQKEEEKEDGGWRGLRVDALSLLLRARESSEAARRLLQPNFVSGLTFELLLAGSETTATTLAFIVYLVSGDERVEGRLVEEIDAFGPPDKPISMADVDSFTYLDQIMKESMRLYTTTPVVARELSEDMTLGGHFLPKGTAIWMALIAVFKDPKNYPDPEVFRPERFDQESEETKNRSPYAFFPFGIGPRTCIGYKFATMEIKMLLIQIYRRFIIHRSPLMEETLELEFGMIVRPAKDILVRVHRRHL